MKASIYQFNKKPVIYIPSAIMQALNLKRGDRIRITIEEDYIKITKANECDANNTAKVALCAKYSNGRQYYALKLPEELAKKIEEKFGKRFEVRIKIDNDGVCAVYSPLS